MSTKPNSQAAIARELGLSKSSITKLKAQGMPVHSVEAARTWRRSHLDHRRMRPEPGPSPRTLVQRAERLAVLAAPLCTAGRFALVEAELRAALRDVPQSHRAHLRMPVVVWNELTDSVSNALPRDKEDLSDTEADVMGRFWFDVAAAACSRQREVRIER